MISEALSQYSLELTDSLKSLTFQKPVTHTYNPLEYAWNPYFKYLQKFADSTKKTLFLGMNPGPWGMAQTGVPFGEVSYVRDWLKINEPVNKPKIEHPKRPIKGFNCTKSEVSGKRLWGLFAKEYKTPELFFEDHFVLNFCPLIWMAETGKNITPDKLPKKKSLEVKTPCQKHLAKFIKALQPKNLIGIGNFAEKQLTETVTQLLPNHSFFIGKILHPSPASPAANKNWEETANKQLIHQNIWPT